MKKSDILFFGVIASAVIFAITGGAVQIIALVATLILIFSMFIQKKREE
jgi:hypothetical protein